MFKNKAGQVRSGWLILFGFFALSVVESFFAVPGLKLLAEAEGLTELPGTTEELLFLLSAHPWLFLFVQGGGALGGIFITFYLWRYINQKPLREFRLTFSFKDFLFGLLLGALSITLIVVVFVLTGQVTLETSLLRPTFSIYTFTFLLIFVTGALFEELFFRGYIMQTMANRGNPKWLIYVASASIFSIVHLSNPHVNSIGLINIALVGLLLAYMFEVTGRLWLPIGYHLTWNYFQGSVFGFPVSGLDPHGLYAIDLSGSNVLVTGGSFGIEGGLMATVVIHLSFLVTSMYQRRFKAQTK